MSLLERDHELAVAGGALRAAAAGHGGVVIAGGPPGAGRSALLDAVAGALPAAGFRVLRAGGAAAERDYPFGVVQQLCQPLVAGGGDARWFRGAAVLARPLLVDEPWSAEHVPCEAILHGLHMLLVHVSADRPVLLVVDDLQWADEPSLRWLGYLAKRLAGARVVLAGAVAESAEPLPLAEIAATRSLELAPLSVHGIRALVAEKFGVDGAPEFALACHEVTSGNPAALAAVLDGLRAKGFRPDAAAAGEVVEAAQPLLCARRLALLAAAPEPVRALTRAMVVLGEEASPELLCSLAGLDRVRYTAAVRGMGRAGLLADGEVPRLVHESVRDGVAAGMTVEARERLHQAAASASRAAGRPAEEVAGHLLRTGPGFARWEVDALRAAAGAALDRGAAPTAARYLRKALLDNPTDGADRARLLVDLAAAERGLDPAAAARHIATALPFLDAGAERAAAALWIPAALVARQPWLGVLVRQAADDLPAGADRDRLAARVHPPSIVDYPVDGPAGRELLAVHAHEATRTGTLPAAEVAALVAGILEHEPPSPAHVHTPLTLLVPTAVAADEVTALRSWLAKVWAAARAEPAGVRSMVAAECALLHAATGRLGRAAELAKGILATADPSWPEATELATEALTTVALWTRDATLVDPVSRPLRDLAAGDLAAARDGLPARWAAWCAHGLGERDEAASLAEEEHRTALAWGSPAAVGRSLRLRAGVTPGPAGVGFLRAAVEVLRGSADRLELSASLITLGRRAADRGAVTEGDRIAAACGVEWGPADPLGPVARVVRSERGTLTRAEDTVVAMVLRGRTNQQIADTLAVTRRAVEKNLTGVYRKLGVSGRAALVARLGAVTEEAGSVGRG